VARVRDLWFDRKRRKTARHPDRGGNKDAKRWLALWIGADSQEHSKAFAKQSDAEKYATVMEADALRGIRYADPRRGAITVREYGEDVFLPSMLHLRPNSADTYAARLHTQIYPLLGNRKMGTITRTDVQSLINALSGRLAPATIRTTHAVLRVMMQSAVDADPQVIPVNPCTRIKVPRPGKRVVEPLPAAAVAALHDTITPRYRVMVALGAGLGLREGEALGLTMARVDFLHRRVHIREQAQRGKLTELKTAASTRTIPADEWVLNEISAHVQRYGAGPGEMIVANRSGGILQRSNFWTYWHRAVTAAGLPEGTRFHDLRHFYASTLIAANLNPKVIQVRLGHATIAETMDTYGHLFPEAGDLGRGAIDSILGQAVAEQERNQQVRLRPRPRSKAHKDGRFYR
jgi:integrase